MMNRQREFENAFSDSLLTYALISGDVKKKKENLASAHRDLGLVIYRLYLVVGIYVDALKNHRP